LKPIGLNILLTHLWHIEKENLIASDDCEHLFARKLIEDIKKVSTNSILYAKNLYNPDD